MTCCNRLLCVLCHFWSLSFSIMFCCNHFWDWSVTFVFWRGCWLLCWCNLLLYIVWSPLIMPNSPYLPTIFIDIVTMSLINLTLLLNCLSDGFSFFLRRSTTFRILFHFFSSTSGCCTLCFNRTFSYIMTPLL
jgi:hypothetical protein